MVCMRSSLLPDCYTTDSSNAILAILLNLSPSKSSPPPLEEGGPGREGVGEGGGGGEEAGSSQPGAIEPPVPLSLECVNTLVMQAKMRYSMSVHLHAHAYHTCTCMCIIVC